MSREHAENIDTLLEQCPVVRRGTLNRDRILDELLRLPHGTEVLVTKPGLVVAGADHSVRFIAWCGDVKVRVKGFTVERRKIAAKPSRKIRLSKELGYSRVILRKAVKRAPGKRPAGRKRMQLVTWQLINLALRSLVTSQSSKGGASLPAPRRHIQPQLSASFDTRFDEKEAGDMALRMWD